ncbi:dTDP-glucose 4,6-dehydratase [Thalassotalea sediminis]|uniref:dTDP-glucose 4,6-dehydratase n=1 Tax=Thalassotalea sediminis TaxID=1759089 RepID=UPI00257227AE|nr:dTDP-glucose 4,6-dehydratase [Thalassotalea sediminis]
MSNERNKSILITGGAGFIGANFVHYWHNKYPQDTLIIYDVLTYAGNLTSINDLIDEGKVYFVKGDIADRANVESVMQTYDVCTIVNFAAESHVDRSINGATDFIQTNIVGTFQLLEAAKNVWLAGDNKENEYRFHHVSTDEVYGSLTSLEPAFTEKHQYQPNSPYSASKAASDHLVRAYHHTYGLNVTTSNCSNNYGPYHYPEKLIPLVITNILHDRPLPVYGDGQQVRDWLHVVDHCRGIEAILQHGKIAETYNIGGENEWQNIDIVKLICQIMNDKISGSEQYQQLFPCALKAKLSCSEALISYVEDRPGHDVRYAIDNSKIKKELGFQVNTSFKQGLEQTIDWYLNNTSWWMPLI